MLIDPPTYLIDLLVIYLVDADDICITAQEGCETDDCLGEQLWIDLRGVLNQCTQDSHYRSENSALMMMMMMMTMEESYE
jgi:hypothetical protein